MWVVGWWNRIYCIVDLAVAIVGRVDSENDYFFAVHIPTCWSYNPATPLNTYKYYNTMLVCVKGRHQIVTSTCRSIYCKMLTLTKWFEIVVIIPFFVQIHVILIARRAFFLRNITPGRFLCHVELEYAIGKRSFFFQFLSFFEKLVPKQNKNIF